MGVGVGCRCKEREERQRERGSWHGLFGGSGLRFGIGAFESSCPDLKAGVASNRTPLSLPSGFSLSASLVN